MEYRILKKEELDLLGDIDRSELVEYKYIYNRDKKILELVEDHYDITGWDRAELGEYIERLRDIVERRGLVLGAFDGDKIVGLCGLDTRLFGRDKTRLKLDILYVSKDYRGRGIGRGLVDRLKTYARQLGARSLYISATPFKNTVDFYRALGGEPTDDIDEELYRLEPEDIHMEIFISCG